MQWIGGPSFLLEMGPFRLLVDPVFGEGDDAFTMPGVPPSEHAGLPAKRLVPLPAVDIDGLDAVVLTRIGEDHFDHTAAETLDVGLRVITPDDDTEPLLERGFTDIESLAWGQKFTAEKHDRSLTIIATQTTFGGERPSNGYVAVHTGGGGVSETAYWTGDTRWFSGARQIKEVSDRFDLFIPYVGDAGDHGTLDGKDAMQFVFLIRPKRIVPVNYNTFSHYNESIRDFEERIGLTLYEKKLVILEEGEIFER